MFKTRLLLSLICIVVALTAKAGGVVEVTETPADGVFALCANGKAATIFTDGDDYKVVGIAALMLADDVERVTGTRPELLTGKALPKKGAPLLVAGTLGHSAIIDNLVSKGLINVDAIKGKWESFVIATVRYPKKGNTMLVIVGSDRRGTAFGMTTLSEAIGVSPWYWWADVTPARKEALYVAQGTFCQQEPSVQYRGIFINDERFGGWARWAERRHGQVGPKTYQKVFELLLRLKANYLWPAMHPGTQAFNDDPENARLADDYAIVMGSSHCEQMLRNNEGEWKAVNERARAEGKEGLGDFNYITNRKTMQDYWETRVKTNGRYENTYTLGLRGIHDYPMEGANSTQERVRLMQQAIDDQRDMLQRNINKPIEDIPQVLCKYEEVLDAYHNGLQVPDDVTLLWSDDKHGYCRNLSNPKEQQRKGGAGIYYHLSYHGDPASWIWLSPLSLSFIAEELTKAYTFGARKIWVFNVGDIKPAEKEITFAMELAWDINRWQPTEAHKYIEQWAAKTFGETLAPQIAGMQERYYRLQAAGKDAHVWFVDYTEDQITRRVNEARAMEKEAEMLAQRVPERLQDAYFELVSYPIRGGALINEYQLLARRSMVRAESGDSIGAIADAERVKQVFGELNQWTRHYNEDIARGKWREFFNWQPYHWFRSEKIEQAFATPELIAQARHNRTVRFKSNNKKMWSSNESSLDEGTMVIVSDADCDIPLWINALTPIRNFSKAPEDNVFCKVTLNNQESSKFLEKQSSRAERKVQSSNSFYASATPINNVWHAPYVGPMWSNVGTLHLKKGENRMSITELKEDARIDNIYIGLWPPFQKEARQTIEAADYQQARNSSAGTITTVEGLGFSNGVMVLPFDTPSYDETDLSSAPCVSYDIDIRGGDTAVEVRTLPTLHVYEGREVRYAVQLGNEKPVVFSIHADDFCAEWRWNVLRGYSSRSVKVPASLRGKQPLKIYLLDPGVVIQEVRVN